MPVDNDRFRKMCVWLMPQRKRCQILLAIDVKPYGPTQGQGAEGFKLHPLPGGFQERDLTRCPNTRDLLIPKWRETPSTSLDETDIIDIIWWPVRIILFRICVWKEGSAMGFFVYRGALFRIPKSFVEHSNIVQPFKPRRTLPFAAFSLVCQGCHLPSFPSVGYHHEYQFFLVESSCYSLLVVSAFSSHFQPFLETFPAM